MKWKVSVKGRREAGNGERWNARGGEIRKKRKEGGEATKRR